MLRSRRSYPFPGTGRVGKGLNVFYALTDPARYRNNYTLAQSVALLSRNYRSQLFFRAVLAGVSTKRINYHNREARDWLRGRGSSSWLAHQRGARDDPHACIVLS